MWRSDFYADNPAFQARFGALDARIDQFKAAIPPLVQATSLRPDVVRSLLAIHTLCQCATIQLHTPLSQGRAPSNNKALAAASAAVAVLQGVPVPQLVYVDPIMGVSHYLCSRYHSWWLTEVDGCNVPRRYGVRSAVHLLRVSWSGRGAPAWLLACPHLPLC